MFASSMLMGRPGIKVIGRLHRELGHIFGHLHDSTGQ
jgi:hypothetical protein